MWLFQWLVDDHVLKYSGQGVALQDTPFTQTTPRMNFKYLVLSLASLLRLSAAMDAPPRPLSTLTPFEMFEHIHKIRQETGASGLDIYRSLASESEDCSNLLAIYFLFGASGKVLDEIISKSSNPEYAKAAFEYCLQSGPNSMAHSIWLKLPRVLKIACILQQQKDDFVEYAHQIDKFEKMFDLYNGLRDDGSLLSGVPTDILTEHIFPHLHW